MTTPDTTLEFITDRELFEGSPTLTAYGMYTTMSDLRKRDIQAHPAVINGQLVIANPIARSDRTELLLSIATYYPSRAS